MRLIKSFIFLSIITSVLSFTVQAASTIKQSKSGICHPPQSNWYERTQTYTAFGTVQSCLEAGGRLPKGLSVASLNSAQNEDGKKGYERSAFGHGWDDANGDCRDSRAEALVASSTTKVRFATDQGCRVVTGRWISSFTGNVVQNSADIDIDHVVPLRWSWDRGAREWTDEKRLRFANDPVNLLPVELSLNRSKGARGPDEWLPPAGQCGYVARFIRVVKLYDLEPSTKESAWFQDFLEACRR